MSQIELVHWNPRKKLFRGVVGRRLPFRGRRPNNFGDLLGPEVIKRLLKVHGLQNSAAVTDRRLLSIGSVMGMARQNDVVWGSGINGKFVDEVYSFSKIDVRAVRGPLTREGLLKRGQAVPEIYGDPGLLVGRLWNRLPVSSKRYAYTIVPNLNDLSSFRKSGSILDPRSPLNECLDRISQSEFVVGSSLHGIIVAESLGIPARLVKSSSEPVFKYEDYYLGSGRDGFTSAKTVSQALDLGGEPLPQWDATALLDAFPIDLWSTETTDAHLGT